MSIDTAIKIIEKYGGVAVKRPDLDVPCLIYELDPLKHNKIAFAQELKVAGFHYANAAGADYFNRVASSERLVKDSHEFIGDETGENANRRILDALLAGNTVRYASSAEKEHVQSLMAPGMISVPMDDAWLSNREKERINIIRGQAVILANPHSPNVYLLITQKI